MHREIESVEALRHELREGGALESAVVQGIALSPVTEELLAVSAKGAVFLGCDMSPTLTAHIAATGGLIFPRLPDVPYQPYRPALYTVDELMSGYVRGDHRSFVTSTLDARIYAHYDGFRRRDGALPILEALAQRLHDHAIDDAKHDLLHGGGRRKVVGIMGGHAMRRDDRSYRDVVRIAQRLTERGFMVTTGGGPGAMEAGHLGAWLAGAGDEAIGRAIALLQKAPTYADEGWFDTAYEARELAPRGGESLAIPTWFYGHEPSNLFASHVAKYFSNSLREDGLLAIAHHGVIYAPGSAGTIQEIFMDAAQNHYGTYGDASPMVFLGVDYWTRDKPVYPLLEGLARGRTYADLLTLSDDPEAVADFIENHPPKPIAG